MWSPATIDICLRSYTRDELLHIRFISRQTVGEGRCRGDCRKSSRHVLRLHKLISLMNKGRLVIYSINKESIHCFRLRSDKSGLRAPVSLVQILHRPIFFFSERRET